LNIDSKCRTAFRRKVRGQPLTVKAFRGKTAITYIPVEQPVRTDSDEDTNSMQGSADSVLQINEVCFWFDFLQCLTRLIGNRMVIRHYQACENLCHLSPEVTFQNAELFY